MQHLSVRLTYKTHPKAALKATDKLIQEVEKLRRLHWAYAFRILRVCLGKQLHGPSDTAAGLQNLTEMAATADKYGHIAVKIVAATMEALIYLGSDAIDAVDLAQRAIAWARTYQLSPQLQGMPQIRILLDCLDLSCSFADGKHDEINAKMEQMHRTMDPASHEPGWSKDGTVSIEMFSIANTDLELDTGGLMRTASNGLVALNLRWTNQNEIYVVGYLLSGIAQLYQVQAGKAESYLHEVRPIPDLEGRDGIC